MGAKKILLVDDDRDFNDTVKEILADAGYDVVTAFDGEMAKRVFRSEQPDLVITDIIMPEEDGLGFMMSITGDDREFPCKIIAMSGGGRIKGFDYLETARVLGVDDTLEKPFGMNDLLECIGEQLN